MALPRVSFDFLDPPALRLRAGASTDRRVTPLVAGAPAPAAPAPGGESRSSRMATGAPAGD